MSAVVNPTSPPKKFQFVGGEVCLDFTNTVGGKRGLSTREYLNSYADFVSWCRQTDLLNATKADALLRSAARHADESGAALRRAIALREAIYRIFAALASNESPQASDLDHLNPVYWQTLTNMAGDGGVVTVTDSTQAETQQFYRVKVR